MHPHQSISTALLIQFNASAFNEPVHPCHSCRRNPKPNPNVPVHPCHSCRRKRIEGMLVVGCARCLLKNRPPRPPYAAPLSHTAHTHTHPYTPIHIHTHDSEENITSVSIRCFAGVIATLHMVTHAVTTRVPWQHALNRAQKGGCLTRTPAHSFSHIPTSTPT